MEDSAGLALPAAAAGGTLERLRRRCVTVPAFVVAFVAVAALSPLLLVAALGADVVTRRRHLSSVRIVAFLVAYLGIEVLGLCALAAIGLFALGRPARRAALTWSVQRGYTGLLVGAVRALFRVRFSVEQHELAAAGPYVVLARHASIVDTLLPGAFIANRFGVRLRYVLKKELLADPCLDVAGHWIPNHFVERDGADTASELEAVRALKAGIGPDEGVLIYPEGTRFSPAKRARALDRAAGDPVALERAERLKHVLPPRRGGTLALLDAAPPCDVLFLGHHGLGGLARIGDIWRGALVGRHVRLRFWRESAASVPSGDEARIAWLAERWQRLDDWVDSLGPESLDA